MDEDCCQAEQLVDVGAAVSFGITPQVDFILKRICLKKLNNENDFTEEWKEDDLTSR